MFPLLSKDGGVLVRKGHTEATVDLMRIAGLKECGLCCEIMKDNGDMMRRDDLLKFAKEHNLKIITVSDLIFYRKKNEDLMELYAEAKMPTKYGDFKILTFVNKITKSHHIVLIKGDIEEGEDIILELSSFQLETIENFHPHISAILNIAEDHLDRYKDIEDYFNAKKNI